jgi:hypothetical protein
MNINHRAVANTKMYCSKLSEYYFALAHKYNNHHIHLNSIYTHNIDVNYHRLFGRQWVH